jgi:23S rRNA (cytidine1920-2'-O)/16S rRNA (cytidine1409-2'-O)-methyltransferase
MTSDPKRSSDRQRLDLALVDRGLAESRHKAQALIMAGAVRVDGQVVVKPALPVAREARLEVAQPARFVSRGGEKLDHALRVFGLDVAGLFCLDVGASTGGFTDCLLQRGAARVAAVDVGRGQLHARLRADDRVLVREGINARYLAPADLPEPPGFACVDVSFISLAKVLPAVTGVLRPGAALVTLVKPQFEAGRDQVARGGVVRDPAVRVEALARVRRAGEEGAGLVWVGMVESPLLGPAGNVEFLVEWRRP